MKQSIYSTLLVFTVMLIPLNIFGAELPNTTKTGGFSGGTFDGMEIDANGNIILSKNLIPNGSFEIQGASSTDAAGWSQGSYFTRRNDRVYSGSYSMRADISSTGSQATITTNDINVTPGCSYKLSGRVYRDSIYAGNAYLDMNDITNDPTVGFSTIGAWTYSYATYNNSSYSTVKIRMVHDNIAQSGSAWWDDIRLENVSVNENVTSGTYTIAGFECDTTTTFGRLTYIADIPGGCSIVFQTRSASSLSGLTGPFDVCGTATSSSGEFEITSNPNKCIQWRALFYSSSTLVNPALKQVVIYPAVRAISTGTSPILKGGSIARFTIDFDVVMNTTNKCTITITPSSGNDIVFNRDNGTWDNNKRFTSESKQISGGGGFATVKIAGGTTLLVKTLYYTSSSMVFIDSSDFASTKLSFFPDPFSPNSDGKCDQTNLFLTYSIATSVIVNIYDLKGMLIKRLFDGEINGNKSISWDGTDDDGLACHVGVYLFQVRAGTDVKAGTVVLTK